MHRRHKYDIIIICGKNYVHLLFNKVPSFNAVNKIIDKYCEWAKIKYKKKINKTRSED